MSDDPERFMAYPAGDSITEGQVTEAAADLVPIGDEQAGGIVAYALPAHADAIVELLEKGDRA